MILSAFAGAALRRLGAYATVAILGALVLNSGPYAASIALAQGGNDLAGTLLAAPTPDQSGPRRAFTFNLTPGGEIRDAIRVTNTAPAAVEVLIYPVDAGTSPGGGMVLLDREASLTDVAGWVQFAADRVSLAPGESRDVPFSLSIPGSTPAGEHFGGLIAENASARQSDGPFAVRQVFRAGIPMRVTLPGDSLERLTIRGISAHRVNDAQQAFSIDIANEGNVSLRPTGFLELIDASGRGSQVDFALDQVLPGTTFTYEVIWPSPVAEGIYTARVRLLPSARAPPIEAQARDLQVRNPQAPNDTVAPELGSERGAAPSQLPRAIQVLLWVAAGAVAALFVSAARRVALVQARTGAATGNSPPPRERIRAGWLVSVAGAAVGLLLLFARTVAAPLPSVGTTPTISPSAPVQFPSVVLNGLAQTIAAASSVQVVDESAPAGAWSLQLSATQFSTPATDVNGNPVTPATLPSTALAIQTGMTTEGSPTFTTVPISGAGSPLLIRSQPAGGTATVPASYRLTIPPSTSVGAYSSTLTYTVFGQVTAVGNVSAAIAPANAGGGARYEVHFTTSALGALAAGGDAISVVFPAGTTVPANLRPADVLVSGDTGCVAPVPVSAPLTISGQTVTLKVPTAIPSSSPACVIFSIGAGIINPGTPGNYSLQVSTSVDALTVSSLQFTVLAAPAAPPVIPWTQVTPGVSPSARSGSAMIFDTARNNIVLFGGADGSAPLGDTWTWDGFAWTQRTPAAAPPARHSHGLAYDAANARVVLFGGYGASGPLQDTWTWNGNDWAQLSPAHSPPARFDHAMVYDAARANVLLFGGANASLLNDSWTWNGVDWSQQAPLASPAPRSAMGLAYRSADQSVVLFSGYQNVTMTADTWTWNGATWTQRATIHQPTAVYGYGIATDPVSGAIVILGGQTQSPAFLSDIWAWDGFDWYAQAPAPAPSSRYDSAMAADPTHGNLVVFGGWAPGVLADTWIGGAVGASVGPVTVTPANDSAGALSGYTIASTATSGLAAGDTVTITFPTGTVVPASMDKANIRFDNDTDCSDGATLAADPVVNSSLRALTLTVPAGKPVASGSSFRVCVGTGAGLTNPSTAANYTVTLSTSRDPAAATSAVYAIAAATSVSNVAVILSDSAASIPSDYTITANTSHALTAGVDTITVSFPSGTTVPGGIAATSVSFDGDDGGTASCASTTGIILAPIVNGPNVTLTISESVAAGAPFTICFALTAGLVNPATAGSVVLTVTTSQDTLPVLGSYLITTSTTTTVSWSGLAGDGLWTSPNNWSSGAAPTTTNHAVINPAAPATVIFRGATNVARVTVGPGHSLTIQGNCSPGTATLTVATSFTNAGTLVLDSPSCGYDATVTITSGTLTNTGTINTNPGVGGNRTINGNLDNQPSGTINLNANTTFGGSTSGLTRTNSGALTVASGQTLTISGTTPTFTQAAGTLTINGTYTAGGASTFTQSGGTTTLAGAFSMTGGSFNLNGGSFTGPATPVLTNVAITLGSSFPNLVVKGSAGTLNGNIVSDQTLTIQGDCSPGTAVLTAATSFTNAGTLVLDSPSCGYDTTVTITSGTLTNTGTINTNLGVGGNRTINGNLDNQPSGTINLSANTTFGGSTSGLTRTNSGALTVASGQTLTISGTTPTFTQAAGTLTINGTYTAGGASTFTQSGGTTTLAGAFSMTGGSFNLNGGSFTGTATPTLTNVAITLGSSFPNLVVRGTSSTLNGNIVSGQTLTIQGNCSPGTATLTVATSFTNAGTLVLDSPSCGYDATVTITSGTLTNTGTINANLGSGGNRTINGNLDNQPSGTINLNANTTFGGSTSGLTRTNSGALTVASGQTLTISGTTPTFTQAAGTLTINGTYTAGGASTFTQSGGTTTLAGAFSMTGGSFNLNGGSFTGPATPVLTNVAITLGSSFPNLVVKGSAGTLNGNIVSDQTLTIQGDCSPGTAVLTAATSFTNAGNLVLDSPSCGYASTLTLTSGTLTNTGTINTNLGVGGNRTINGNLDNQPSGTINLNANTTFGGSTSGLTRTNSGALTVASGQTLTISGTTPTFTQAAGTLTINGTYTAGGASTFTQSGGTTTLAGAFSMTGGSFNLNGGSFTGPATPVLTNVAITLGSSFPNLVVKGSAGTLNGNIVSDQTLTIQGNCSPGTAVLTAATSFTNAGTLVLDSPSCGYASTLTLTSGTLTNTGTINANLGSGGNRTINGAVTNSGTIRPGGLSAAGTLTVNGAYTQGSGGTLEIELGGTASGAFDKLAVSGTANLGGTLAASPLNYTVLSSDSFQILTATTIVGDFATYNITPATLAKSLTTTSLSLVPDGTAPTISSVVTDLETQSKLNVTFSEAVYTAFSGAPAVANGALTAADFVLPTDPNGRTISNVTHAAGTATAVLTLSGDSTPGTTTLAAVAGEIFDTAGNAAATTPVLVTNGTRTLTWTSGPSLNTARRDFGATVANLNNANYFFAIGGEDATNTVLAQIESSSPGSAWSIDTPALSSGRKKLGIAEAGGRIFAIGGENSIGTALTTVEAYDLTTVVGSPSVTQLSTPRLQHGVASVNGKIYVIGGQDGSGPVATVEEFNPAANSGAGSWTSKTPMPTARYGMGVATYQGKIYVVGGYGSGYVDKLEVYTPANDTWDTTRASIPVASRYLSFSAASNGRLYAVGGATASYAATTSVYEYNPSTNVWYLRTPMSTGRASFALLASPSSGNLYAIGGTTDSGTTNGVERLAISDANSFVLPLSLAMTNRTVTPPPTRTATPTPSGTPATATSTPTVTGTPPTATATMPTVTGTAPTATLVATEVALTPTVIGTPGTPPPSGSSPTGLPTETLTAVPPTATSVPPSETPTAVLATATSVPLTESPTAVPGIATSVPLTETPTAVPATATSVPPTDTPTTVPPTATSVPPTATAVPPTATAVPPTATDTPAPTNTPVPPTSTPVPPTATPTNTSVPPTATPTRTSTATATRTATPVPTP